MCRLFLVSIAIIMIFMGTFLLLGFPKLIQQKVEQKVPIKINEETYTRFTKVPIPITVKYHFFNITNSGNVLAGIERPKFQEIGPFVFKQWRRREVVDFEDDNRKLKYREIKTFYSAYDPSKPETGLDPRKAKISIINVPLLSFLTQLSKLPSPVAGIASQIVTNLVADRSDKIIVTKMANQLLFDGYKVDFLLSTEDLISETLGFNFPSPLPDNTFGFFYRKNDTWNRKEAGEVTIYTGRNGSMKDFMLIDNWNGLKELQVWPNNTIAGSRCNQIRGTDGSSFHPGVTRDSILSIFSPMICTSIHIKYMADTSTRDIPLYRFSPLPDTFAAPKKTPKNACYCSIQAPNQPQQPKKKGPNGFPVTEQPNFEPQIVPNGGRAQINDSRCYLDGLLDLSLCQRGAPIAASGAHFYGADPMLALASGLTPKKELHETYLDIEPMTGAVFRAASRAQLNAFVEQAALNVLDSQIVGNMSAMVAPLMWLEEAAEIDDKSSQKFKNVLLNNVSKLRRGCFVAIGLGIIIIICVAFHFWYFIFYDKPEHGTPRAKRKLISSSL